MEVNEINTFTLTNGVSIDNTATSDEISYSYDNSSTSRSKHASRQKVIKNLAISLVAITAAGVSITNLFFKTLPSIVNPTHSISEDNVLTLSFSVKDITNRAYLAIYLYDKTTLQDVDVKQYKENGEYVYTYNLVGTDSYTAKFIATNGFDLYRVIQNYEIR